jgi:hypothetical protein
LADAFKYWGIWLGGVWTEQIEGTNGIGTCITADSEHAPLFEVEYGSGSGHSAEDEGQPNLRDQLNFLLLFGRFSVNFVYLTPTV